ncbi:MAG: DUF2723 domain-containing protein, partial [Acidobacteriota bacterium]
MEKAKKTQVAVPKDQQQELSASTQTTSRPLSLRTLKTVLAIATFIVALAGYFATLARTVTLVDSGELILTCTGLGVAHPPGFPLYTLLGNLFTKLPFGSVAARVSFMSALFAALTAVFLALIMLEISPTLAAYSQPLRDKKRSLGKGTAKITERSVTLPTSLINLFTWLMPLATGLTLAFSVTLWFYATVAEVYTLNLALLAAIIYIMLRWHRIRTASKKDIPLAEGRMLILLAA